MKNKEIRDLILEGLKREVVPAMGCTEPVAIALSAAYSAEGLSGNITKIQLKVSGNVYKNAKAVGIPGTKYTGIEMALALGASIGEPHFDLTLLASLTPEDIERAEALMDKAHFDIEIVYDSMDMYIETSIETNQDIGMSILHQSHTNLVYLMKHNKVLLDHREKVQETLNEGSDLVIAPISQLMKETLTIPAESLMFLLEGMDMNMSMAEAGLEMDQGLSLGQSWKRIIHKGLMAKDLGNEITMYTSAACDARMSGVQRPVMTSSGSGNNGLIAIIPITLVSRFLGSSQSDVVHALAISHVVNATVKSYIGRLSPVCGCGVSAGAGAAAAMVHLLGGDTSHMEKAVVNVVSSLAGMICDGGKVGCALKMSASASMAWQSALLAMENIAVPMGNGIVGDCIEKTLENLGRISREGMHHVDRSVIIAMQSSTGLLETSRV